MGARNADPGAGFFHEIDAIGLGDEEGRSIGSPPVCRTTIQRTGDVRAKALFIRTSTPSSTI